MVGSEKRTAHRKVYWNHEDDAALWLLEEIRAGKPKLISDIFTDSFFESHTYLVLLELGVMSPPKEDLLLLYKAETTKGFKGFLTEMYSLYPQLREL